MKYFKWLLPHLWLLLSLQLQAQNKRALIIAIGDYPKVTDWPAISSVNDVSIIGRALARQGFSQIDSLKNEQATKKGIVDAMTRLAESCKPGDIVIVHVSSHGQQIDDNNGDEMDGYDEAIVAYGAPMYSDDGYKGENHLRDEEFGELLDNIRARLGKNGDLLVFIDACHSGTGTRGEEKARGGAEPIHVQGAVKNIRSGEDNNNLFEDASQSRGAGESLSPMVVFSGASADERNFEYKGFGSLSTAISRSFDQLNPETSYRTWWAQIMKEMSVIAPYQHPVAEGDMNRDVFGGKVVQLPRYYDINTANGTYITLFGGKINGLFEGTEIAIYEAGTMNIKDKQPLATGKIGFCEYNFASANLNQPIPGKTVNYWAFVTRQTFGNLSFNARINIPDKKIVARVQNALKDDDLINLDSKTPDFEIVGDYKTLTINRLSDGNTFAAALPLNDTLQQLKDAVLSYLQGKFITELDLKDPSIHVELNLIPVRIENRRVADSLKTEDFYKNGVWHFKDGDRVLVQVINKGSKPAYYSILNIEANGKIGVFTPDPTKNEDPKTLLLTPGQSYIVPGRVMRMRGPAGRETLKVFASHEAMNFGPLVATKGDSAHRGNEKSVERVFRSALKPSQRGDSEDLLPDSECNTTSLIIQIDN